MAENEESQEKQDPGTHDDGKWHLLSTGVFVQVLIDSGLDPAVFMRVVEDQQHDDGTFTRRMEIVSAPNGHVLETARSLDCHSVHRVIRQFIEQGLVQ